MKNVDKGTAVVEIVLGAIVTLVSAEDMDEIPTACGSSRKLGYVISLLLVAGDTRWVSVSSGLIPGELET